MDGTFVKELMQRAPKPEEIDLEGVKHVLVPNANGWSVVDPRKMEPRAEALEISTLTGLVDYIEANRDHFDAEKVLLHVADEQQVDLVSTLRSRFREREALVRVTLPAGTESFRFGVFTSAEDFVIALQTLFVDTPERGAVLAVAGNIKEEAVRTTSDDGVTQTVVQRSGAHLGEATALPNPVTLRPYRTFREIVQPESLFVLRGQGGKADIMPPQLALFEADGGAWKLEAIQRIRAYLTERIKGITVLA